MSKHKTTIYRINSDTVKFQCLKDSKALSHLLHFEFNSFVRVIENASYEEFSIPKKKGGKRVIEVPNEYLMYIQKSLNRDLQAVYYKIKPHNVYGFVQAVKSEPRVHTVITNAQNHIGKSYVLNIDLKDFFHSITAIQVRAFFQSNRFNFSEDLATCLALICCWKSRLPMGAATSPVVSNLLCLGMDESLATLANQYNLTYSRYADDLTFSSYINISEDIITEIREIITDKGFCVNEKKFRLQSKYRQQTVTGIKVNQKTNVDRRYIRKIRAVLNDIKWNGIEKAAMKHYALKVADEKAKNTLILSMTGKINFVGQVKGKSDLVYNKLRQQLACIN